MAAQVQWRGWLVATGGEPRRQS